ncbi:HNH endonuclease [Streptomyces sp. JJ66]|uniref:HNH endonuclease family protein n=1 Tax=Streptomyces sp. JJ66 TaxID=2803843 RepID=UPI001C561CAE|nr:HNH endonuclease family protein [Streptomyces sp. JJ66]MBW1602897.1 HNH endonuclease [Streptomyces sp. JJ66]
MTRRAPAAAVLAALLLATACTVEDVPDVDGNPGAGSAALASLDDLTVKGRAPKSGYDRRKFGSPWPDTDGNGCGTRDDILQRDLTDVTVQDDCTVTSGTLTPDPFTGERVTFERGGRSEVDIDHLVALSDAWQKGAHAWEPAKRIAFANDPLNLLAVDASANRAKGDADAATWLPPHKPYRCAYAAAQVAVKDKYELWVTQAEHAALTRVLTACPDEPLPTGTAPTTAPPDFTAPR